MQITRCPLPSRCSQRWEPRKPAPPVTTQVLIGRGCYRATAGGRVRRDLLQFRENSDRSLVQQGGEIRSARGFALPCLVRRSEPVQGELSGGNRAAGATSGAAASRSEAARKRAAVELIARHERALRRTARRYSLCADDADDAYQRALEILLTKAPTDDPRELIRWTQTVIKHEALAVRREPRAACSAARRATARAMPEDWVALIPAPAPTARPSGPSGARRSPAAARRCRR